jgi:hypothetical protein
MSDGLRRAGVGKFEGGLLLDRAVYEAVLDGWVDDEVGSARELGWFGIIRFGKEGADDLLKLAKESGITLNRDEIRFVKRNKGVIESFSK